MEALAHVGDEVTSYRVVVNHELAEQPISDEVLEARIEQARAVDQSRGWKHLLKA